MTFKLKTREQIFIDAEKLRRMNLEMKRKEQEAEDERFHTMLCIFLAVGFVVFAILVGSLQP